MKSYKDIVQQLDEVLTKSTPAGTWIKDFVDSDNPKFAGKSPAKRKQMALAAYYGKQKEKANESYAGSQNSTAETQMNEDHLVHVNDGSKYDEQPHEKDVEHVMHGAKKHGGENAGLTDKGVLFKFKNHSDAHNFISHVNKCPHRSCDAHMTESVDYDKPTYLRNNPKEPTKKSSWTGFNTDEPAYKRKEQAELEKKRLNKEEVELIDEISKKTLGSYIVKSQDQVKKAAVSNNQSMRGSSDAIANNNPALHDLHIDNFKYTNQLMKKRAAGVQKAVSKLTKEETIAEDVDKEAIRKQYKKNESDNRHTENAELLAKHFGSKRDQNQVAKAKAYRDKHNGYGGDILGRHHSNLAHEIHKKLYDKLHEEVNEAKVYDPFTKKMVPTKPIKVQAGGGATRNGVPVEGGPSKYKTLGDAYRAATAGQTVTPKQKLKNEEVEPIDEISKKTLASYIPKAAQSARLSGQIATDFDNRAQSARKPQNKASYERLHMKYKNKAWDREDNIAKAANKLAKEETEQIDEISKSTLMRYIPKATRDVADHVAQAKDHQLRQIDATAAGNWDASKVSNDRQKKSFNKAIQRIKGVDTATKKLGTQKEEVQVDEATHQVYDTKTHKVHSTHDTYKKAVNAMNKLNKEHPGYDTPGGLEQSKFGAKTVNESRGHKVIATFLKNREIAQRAYQGNPAKDAEVAQGGGSPADQGIAAAKKDAEKLKKEAVNPALMAIMKRRQAAQDKKDDKKKLSEDQYTSEYKIKQFVDPITGENKERKIRPHRVNFKSSKMNAAPAQETEPTKVTEDDKVYDEKWKKFTKGAK